MNKSGKPAVHGSTPQNRIKRISMLRECGENFKLNSDLFQIQYRFIFFWHINAKLMTLEGTWSEYFEALDIKLTEPAKAGKLIGTYAYTIHQVTEIRSISRLTLESRKI